MERGDIFHVDLEPTSGRVQAEARYVLIISPKAFNILGTITQGGQFARHAGFAVSMSGAATQTQGVVLCNQVRVLDLQSRGARFVEAVPRFIIDEVLAKVLTLIE